MARVRTTLHIETAARQNGWTARKVGYGQPWMFDRDGETVTVHLTMAGAVLCADKRRGATFLGHVFHFETGKRDSVTAWLAEPRKA